MPLGTTLDLPDVAHPSWQRAAVIAARPLADDVIEVTLRPAAWPGHLAGQYVDIRLPGEDEHARAHSFSLVSPAPSTVDGVATLRIVARADVFEEVPIGATVRLDGPKGQRLAWRPEETGDRPLLLIGGGTGIVPLLAIARAWADRSERARLQLIHSVRSLERRLFHDDLAAIAALPDADVATIVTGSGSGPESAGRGGGRLSAIDLELFGIPPQDDPECFVCGPVAFVESVTRMLVEAKHPAVRVRTEWDVSVEEQQS